VASDRETRTRELIPRLQTGDTQALEEAVTLHLPLVMAMTARMRMDGADPEDLRQNGCVGLIKALRNFDLSYGVCFSTYAVPMILGEMRRSLREDGTIRVSRGIREETARLLRAQEELTQVLGREPTLRDLAERTGITPEEAAFLLASRGDTLSLDAPLEAEGSNLESFLASDDRSDEKAERALLIRQGFSALTDREKKLIYLRYFRDRTQRETASALGVSQVQISRLETKILRKLRDVMRGREEEFASGEPE